MKEIVRERGNAKRDERFVIHGYGEFYLLGYNAV
jgi:hypothetical protein